MLGRGDTFHRKSPLTQTGTVIKVLTVEELMVFENQMTASSLSSVYPASLIEELMQDARDRAGSAVEMAMAILLRAGMKAVSDPVPPVGEPRGVILDTTNRGSPT